jgi:hypothetical protein
MKEYFCFFVFQNNARYSSNVYIYWCYRCSNRIVPVEVLGNPTVYATRTRSC